MNKSLKEGLNRGFYSSLGEHSISRLLVCCCVGAYFGKLGEIP